MKSVSVDFVVSSLNLLKVKYGIEDIDIKTLRDVLTKLGKVEDILKRSKMSKSVEQNSVLAIPIEKLNLSVRSHYVISRLKLDHSKIKTVGQLIQFCPDDLLAHKNFGKISIREVELALSQLNLKLKDNYVRS